MVIEVLNKFSNSIICKYVFCYWVLLYNDDFNFMEYVV